MEVNEASEWTREPHKPVIGANDEHKVACFDDLLAALEGIEPYCKVKYGMDEDAIDAMDAAIQKARNPNPPKDSDNP